MITEEEIRKRIRRLEEFETHDIIADLTRIVGIITLKGVLGEKDVEDKTRYRYIIFKIEELTSNPKNK